MANCNHTTTNQCSCNNRAPVRPAMPCHEQQHHSMSHHCSMERDSLADLPPGMAYVPWQYFNDVYDPDKALQYGTIFPELNKPFYGRGGCPR